MNGGLLAVWKMSGCAECWMPQHGCRCGEELEPVMVESKSGVDDGGNNVIRFVALEVSACSYHH